MNILKVFPENATENKKLMYAMTRGQSVSIKDVENGTKISPEAFCMYVDTNSKGEEKEVLAIVDGQGTVYTTISETFKREFDYISGLMGAEEYEIEVIHGKTKAGRDFVTCNLAM